MIGQDPTVQSACNGLGLRPGSPQLIRKLERERDRGIGMALPVQRGECDLIPHLDDSGDVYAVHIAGRVVSADKTPQTTAGFE
jgi:hypothetical protein